MIPKSPRFESKALRDSARGQPCTFRIPGVCNGNPETSVFCHDRRGFLGKSMRPGDENGAIGCFDCHNVMDGRAPKPAGWQKEDEAYFWNRAKNETLRHWFTSGIVVVK